MIASRKAVSALPRLMYGQRRHRDFTKLPGVIFIPVALLLMPILLLPALLFPVLVLLVLLLLSPMLLLPVVVSLQCWGWR